MNAPGIARGPGAAGARAAAWIRRLDDEFHERSVATRLAVLAPLSGHHLLLLGPPGTAKTMLAQRVTRMLEGRLFSTLVTKFSTPEDLFGPLSLPKLEQGVYERLTDGYLPAAEVAFVDEIFKANASILNSLLSILNERVYFNGAVPVKVPLLSMLAASNEVPDEEDGLDALDDRILIRTCVEPLRDPGTFGRMLRATPIAGSEPSPLTKAEMGEISAAARNVTVGDDVIQAMLELREACRASQLTVSDRRWKQTLAVMRVCAAVDGSAAVGPAHLGALRFMLWRRPEDQPKVIDALVAVLKTLRLHGVTATAQELTVVFGEATSSFDALAAEFQNEYRYSYGREAPKKDLQRRALEALRKARKAISAIGEIERATESALAGPDGLWRPFWADVLPRHDLRKLADKVKAHRFVTHTVPERMPKAAKRWQAECGAASTGSVVGDADSDDLEDLDDA